MRKIDIPIVPVGPGTQPAETDGAELDYMSMPGEMSTFSMPDLPEPELIGVRTTAKAKLEEVLSALATYQIDQPALVFDLTDFGDEDRDIINQVLGEGEVSVIFKDETRVHIQESVLAGIWRVQYLDTDDAIIRDTIEIAAIPSLVKDNTFQGMADEIAPPSTDLPPGVLNAPPLVAELNDKIKAWQPGAMPHVINLTLLPQTEEDLDYLNTLLGKGRVFILSRGYGNCRISSTATQNVWWVQYYNSQDNIILNTLEVTGVPEVACASQEDIQDSQQRLGEILEVYA